MSQSQLSLSCPPGKNAKVASVTDSAKAGRGVGTNLDCTGLRVIKKGTFVRVPGSFTRGTVVKVNRGRCLVQSTGRDKPWPFACATLEVI